MKRLLPWLAASIITTGVFMTVYVVGQQILRQSADEPQTYQAQLAAAQLNKDIEPRSLILQKVPLENSLATVLIIYKLDGSVAASQATLGGRAPVMPIGVLRHADGVAYHAVTWQPSASVRLASVTIRAKDYYVVAARSLSDVEHREKQIGLLVALGWAASMVILSLTYLAARKV